MLKINNKIKSVIFISFLIINICILWIGSGKVLDTFSFHSQELNNVKGELHRIVRGGPSFPAPRWSIHIPTEVSFGFNGLDNIVSNLEGFNWFWEVLNEEAKEEVKLRLSYLDKFVDYVKQGIEESIARGRLEPEVANKISLVIMGSYLWGFKQEVPGEEYIPYDLDTYLIVEGDIKKRPPPLKISPQELEEIFGDYSRQPDKVGMKIFGHQTLLKGLNSDLIDEVISTTIKLMRIRNSGITIAGANIAQEKPPVWAYLVSIKDLLESTELVRSKYEQNKLNAEQRSRLSILRELEGTPQELSQEEEEELRELETKEEIEQEWFLRTVKRVVETNLRVNFFIQHVRPDLTVYNAIIQEFENPFAINNVAETINEMIVKGITEENKYKYKAALAESNLYNVIDNLKKWFSTIEEVLDEEGIFIPSAEPVEF